MHNIKETPAPFNVEVLVFGDLQPSVIGKIRKKCWQPAILQHEYDIVEEQDLDSAKWIVTGDTQYGAVMGNVTHWTEMPPTPAE